MTENEMIEAAAKALGLVGRVENVHKLLGDEKTIPVFFPDDGYSDCFDPLTDQADSDRMGCDLKISTLWNPIREVYCFAGAIGFAVLHDNTVEGRRAAVRLARLQVAAEMWKAGK